MEDQTEGLFDLYELFEDILGDHFDRFTKFKIKISNNLYSTMSQMAADYNKKLSEGCAVTDSEFEAPGDDLYAIYTF